MKSLQTQSMMMQRYESISEADESKLLFQKTKETERKEEEEGLEGFAKNHMQKDQQWKGSFQKSRWDLEELS